MWARQCHRMWVSVIGCWDLGQTVSWDVGQCHGMLGCGSVS